MALKVHFTEGDGKGWALDEDLRQIRSSLAGMIRESGPAGAEVIHAPFWQNLGMVAPDILKRAFVIAHADNPPFFYLKQPEFLAGQQQVDLWVARSREALGQFESLGLPAIHIPYTIDPDLFFPINDKAALRREFGIPKDAYVIANFHRDTEGADLRTPKVQKNPEFMIATLRRLREQRIPFHVLIAGPRRHWIREALRHEGMAFTFVGKEVGGDDFGSNILDRATLNRLYNAADLYLIPSRWEGGPQSAMEAAACGCKILSVPIGVGRDILEPKSLFRTSAEAAQKLGDDIRHGELDPTVQPQRDRWEASHSTATLKHGLQELYRKIPGMEKFQQKRAQPRRFQPLAVLSQAAFTIRRRTSHAHLPVEVALNHLLGMDGDLDEIFENLAGFLRKMGVGLREHPGSTLEIAGYPRWQPDTSASRVIQWISPGMNRGALVRDAVLVAPSVQDVLNIRAGKCMNTILTLPILKNYSMADMGPLIVAEDNRGASLDVWRALGEGRPVIYPQESAYFEQVFHAGLSYPAGGDPNLLAIEAMKMNQELARLAYFPSMQTTERLLRSLLCSIAREPLTSR
jgi:glycosyltransferase involved in cell wall biosynthesis